MSKRVKIIHQGFSDHCWYNKFCGQDFELITEDENNYYVKTGDKIGSVEKVDGKVIEEQEISTHPLLQDLLTQQKNQVQSKEIVYSDNYKGLETKKQSEFNSHIQPDAWQKIGTFCEKCQNIVCKCKIEIPKEKSTKQTEGKLFWEMNWDYLQGVAQRMQANKGDKYEKFAWKKGVNVDEINQAILRHTVEIMKGNTIDDTEYGHYEALCCNAMLAVHELKRLKNNAK